jgi:hypothetical protein
MRVGLAAVLAILAVLSASVAAAEERIDGPTSTQLALLHERRWAWEPAVAVRPTEFQGPIDWIRLQLSGARDQPAEWMEDGGFSLLKDRDPYDGSKRFTFASGALTTKWASVHLRMRLGRSDIDPWPQRRQRWSAFGVTIPWDRFTLEIEALDDNEFGYSVRTGLRWAPTDQRVQYGVALPVSVGGGPSVAAILQILIRLDDSH